MTRDHLVESAKASPVVGYLGAFFSGVQINELATIAALLYSLLLIFDKLRSMGFFRWVAQWLARLHR